MKIYSNENLQNYRKFANLARFTFFLNFPNFILTLITAFTANTVVVWVDTLVTLSETLHSLIVWIVGLKLCKENGDKYNFGMDRFEVFISFLCELLISFGMLAMLGGAVLNILNPSAPDSSLGYFCLMKCSNVSFDTYLYIKQIKICKENPSKLNRTEKTAYLISLINDSVMGVIAVICFFFRNYTFTWYLSPIASIVLAIYFLICYIKHMKVSVAEIVDISLPIEIQDKIYDIVMEEHNIIKRITSVNCRKLNDKAYIEITLIFADNVSYSEMREYLNYVTDNLKIIEPNNEVSLIISNQ